MLFSAAIWVFYDKGLFFLIIFPCIFMWNPHFRHLLFSAMLQHIILKPHRFMRDSWDSMYAHICVRKHCLCKDINSKLLGNFICFFKVFMFVGGLSNLYAGKYLVKWSGVSEPASLSAPSIIYQMHSSSSFTPVSAVKPGQ